MSKPETRLRKKIMDALREEYPQGWFVKIHGNPYQDAGIPDIIGCVDGRFIGIEVKDGDDGEASKIQIKTIGNIHKAGGRAGVARSIDQALEIIRPVFSKT